MPSDLTPKQEAKYYVYALIDPRDGKPFYIGKGSGKRHAHHVYEWNSWKSSGGHRNQRKLARISEIHAAGLSVSVEILEKDLTEAAAFKAERLKIREMRDALTNLSAGCRSELETAFEEINYRIGRMRSPKQWQREWVRTHGRLPDSDEWGYYFDIFRGHVDLRKHIRALMENGPQAQRA